MKKTIAILLVAVLAVSSVFAGFSGKATVGLGYNWETKNYGFSNGTGFDVDVDLTTAEADKVAEGDIYAGIKATMSVKVANKSTKDGQMDHGSNFWNNITKTQSPNNGYALGLFLDVAEAYVAGENWKVAITGTQGATSYAKSFTTHKEAIKDVFGNKTGDEKDVADDVTGSFALNKAPGVTVVVAGFKGSVGFNGSNEKGKEFFNYNAFLETPEFSVDGLTVQAAVGASRNVDPDPENDKFHDFALNTSAKVGYATDALSVAVAADYDAVKYLKDNDTIYSLFDASAKVAFAPVTVDAYYGLNGILAKNLEDNKTLAHTLSAQVATDLAAFDLPVKLTVWGKDILNTMDYGAKAEVTIDVIKLSVNGGYVIDPVLLKKLYNENLGKYYIGADVEYTNDLFTAKAGVGFNSYVAKGLENAAQLTLSASVESSAIIPGATLKLAYGKAKNAQNLLKDQKTVDITAEGLLKPFDQNLGKVEATCTIKF
ncbi:hypothetical protein FYJ80_08955 [Spirochaetales bacterium NM-380-WT-3C1]|uniref:Uncharacterized protein n=1 Tax=Bullifex porci TaxID=2606638 RepID=A0A7X2PDK6_9SPIO|nr:hypothetical protein [Bullifex porci]MSU06898.1 hypothetical protein [Bullifex porci]